MFTISPREKSIKRYDDKGNTGQVNSKSKTMDAFPSIIPIRDTVLPEISSKVTGKHSWLKLRTKYCCKPWGCCKCKAF